MQKPQPHDEIDALARAMAVDSITPNLEFKHRLHEAMLAELDSSRPFNLFMFISQTMHATKKQVAVAGGGVAALGLLATAFTFAMLPGGVSNSLQPADKSADEIFAGLIASGNTSAQGGALRAAGNGGSESDSGDRKMSADLMIYPAETEIYNYYKSVSVAGPAADRCTGYVPYGLNKSTSESFSYWTEDHKSYNKYLVRNANGDIFTYNLSNPNKTYDYAGGSYAVVSPTVNHWGLLRAEGDASGAAGGTMLAGSEQPAGDAADLAASSGIADDTTEPAPAPIEEKPKIEDYFGPDAKILGQEQIDGKTYYVVSWKYDGWCSENASNVKIATKAWVDTEKFSFAKEEIYLDSIAAANLIVTNEHKNDSQKGEFSQFSDKFKFDLNVEVREIDPEAVAPGSEAYLNAAKAMLAAQQIELLRPTNTEFKLEAVTPGRLNLEDPYAYRMDRAFYLAGALGDRLHKEAKDNGTIEPSQVAYLSAGFTRQADGLYQSVWSEVYGSDLNNSEWVSKVNYEGKATVKDIELNTGDTTIAAKLYVQPDQRSEDCPDCHPSFAVTFEKDNHKYVIWFHGFRTQTKVFEDGFKVMETTTDKFFNKLKASVVNNEVIAL